MLDRSNSNLKLMISLKPGQIPLSTSHSTSVRDNNLPVESTYCNKEYLWKIREFMQQLILFEIYGRLTFEIVHRHYLRLY